MIITHHNNDPGAPDIINNGTLLQQGVNWIGSRYPVYRNAHHQSTRVEGLVERGRSCHRDFRHPLFPISPSVLARALDCCIRLEHPALRALSLPQAERQLVIVNGAETLSFQG